MPSPLNTPTSDHEPKSLFDSLENLNILKSSPDVTDGTKDTKQDNGRFSRSDTSSSTSDSSNNLTGSVSIDEPEPLRKQLEDKPVTVAETNHKPPSKTDLSLNLSSEDDDQSWRNSSIKYRRARLNLNLVPLKNLSLPQITPAPSETIPNTGGHGGYRSSSSNGSLAAPAPHEPSGGGSSARSSSTNVSCASGDEYFRFDFGAPYSQPSNHHRHHHSVSPRPPSPKYNPRKFDPIVVPGSQTGNSGALERPGQLLLGGGGSRTKSQSNRICFNYHDAIRIDPAMELEKQEWFHGFIDRLEAEQVLRQERIGSYLVRRWKPPAGSYSLSLKSIFGYIHFRIYHHRDCQANQEDAAEHWSLMPGTMTHTNPASYHCPPLLCFETIPQLVDHYTVNRLPFRGCEHMALLYPVASRLL